MDTPYIADVIKYWLVDHGFDGIYNEDDPCHCTINDLAPCDCGPCGNCKPYKGDWMTISDPGNRPIEFNGSANLLTALRELDELFYDTVCSGSPSSDQIEIEASLREAKECAQQLHAWLVELSSMGCKVPISWTEFIHREGKL